ncbi:hypothetical protein M8C21_029308 [Ambrosia artemisiifolia]|uniref:Uncharacterized protein n=1 Tax=Ambrosia artemisiifolia TaxID=4212 RepID=A0AAD5CDH7_AMBAR|nr:hypothetical protein M8C21_029308 [Ambrosia artemisiifolia]
MSCSDYYTKCRNLQPVKRDPIDSQQHEENENEEDFRTYQRKEKRQRVTSAIKQKTKTVSAHNFKTITKLKLRNPPKPFYNAIKSLSSPQKKKVMDIGFGALLGSNCSGIPSAIGYFVVDSFDPKSMELTLPNGSIQITVELIHHIYRIPHGGTPVNSLVVNDSAKECYHVWKSQFVKDIRASDIAIKIQESDEADMIFVQNFIMLFLNSMVECMPSGSCMTDLLECIDESVDIKSIDWCGYVFESLKRCKRLWKRNDPRCYFTGPIVFLILLYFEATSFEKLDCPSNVQATSFWNVEKMKKREMLEIEDGGIGRCEIKKLTEKVTNQEESELEVTKLLGDIESKLDSLLDVKIALELLFSSGIEKFPECTSLKEKKKLFHDMLISADSKADATIVDLSSGNSEDDDNDAVQNNFPFGTEDFVDGESESCPQCHQNLLVGGTKRYPCPVCCNLDKETSRSNGPTDDIQDQVTLVTNVDDGRISDSNNLQDTSSVLPLPTLSPSVDYQPASLEDQGTSEGLWRGNAVGQPAKEILHAVEDDYPDTFQGLQILPSPYWLSTLKGLHDFIKGFLETSVHGLEEDKLTSLETDLNSFESIGFNLSWVRNRLDLAKKLKFGNDVLRLELVVLEESLKCVHEALVEASARFEKARLDYDRVTYARNKKLYEVAQKFGAEYDGVLNCNLGFGMLPGY